MILIFGDLAFLLAVALSAGLGTMMVFSEWLLEHIAVIGCVLALKSLMVFGSGFEENPGWSVLAILLDILRGTVFLWVASGILAGLFNGSDFLIGLFNAAIGIPLALLASEWPICYAYDIPRKERAAEAIPLEMVSSAALFVVGLIT